MIFTQRCVIGTGVIGDCLNGMGRWVVGKKTEEVIRREFICGYGSRVEGNLCCNIFVRFKNIL